MFNFKLTPLWLFGIIIIVLVVSMLWYNNASIEGFGNAPISGSDVLKHYPNASKVLVDFGKSNKNYFDTNTGNIVRDYDQTMWVINRAGNTRTFIKQDIKDVILTENDEVHKGSTYPAFSVYEKSDNEQLFYISIGTKTFIHTVNLKENKHGATCIIDAGRISKDEFTLIDKEGLVIAAVPPTIIMRNSNINISDKIVNVMELTDGIYYDSIAQLLISKKINDTATDSTVRTDGAESTVSTENFTLFNNRLTNEELEGMTTETTTTTWNTLDRNSVIKTIDLSGNNYVGSSDPQTLVVSKLNNNDGTLQVLMMTHLSYTVIILLTNVGDGESNKYKLLGTVRYIGTTLEQPTAVVEEKETEEKETEEKETKHNESDLTNSAMSEYWKWFHYWNADGASGSSQPMSQDYMLKTDYVHMSCPSCNGKNCETCNNGQGGSGNVSTGGIVGTAGGIVGTAGGLSNNVVNKTTGLAEKAIDTSTGLAEKVIDTGAGLAVDGATLGGDAVSGAVGLGKEATSGAVGLGKEATSGAVGLGKEVTSGVIGLGKDAVSGLKSTTASAIGLGREVATGTIGLGKDVASGTANLIKDTQRNGQYANAGGYASGSNGDIQTKKYVNTTPGGMDPYTYNGLLSKRGGSNYIPLTSDFSAFR